MENTRRSFLKKMTGCRNRYGRSCLSSNAAATVTTETSAEKKKKPAGKDDGKLRFGFIGTGSRCHEHINNVLSIPGNKIVAICDIQLVRSSVRWIISPSSMFRLRRYIQAANVNLKRC